MNIIKTKISYYKKASLILPNSFETKLGLMRVYLAVGDNQNVTNIGYSILKIDLYNYYANLYAIKALIAQKKYQLALSMLKKNVSFISY